MRVIIIDDEEKARITLANYIKTYCPEIDIAAEAESVETGFQAINLHKPDVVFLDIMLSDGSGFNLLKRFKQIDFKIIFVTSYSQYAIKAFRYSAFDYLLKPIDIDELLTVIERLKLLTAADSAVKLDFLENTMNHPEGTLKKIVLATHNNLYVVDLDDIICCDAEDNYTMFYLANETRILVPRTLKDFEEILHDHHFFRTHKSHLVNFKFITRYTNEDGGCVVLKNGKMIPVSVRKKDALIQLINETGLH